MNPDILILCATEEEIIDFPDFLQAKKRFTKTGLSIVSGSINNKKYDIIITGPGTVNTAHALTACLERSCPGTIFQTGIGGIFKNSGMDIGDVAVATLERYVHTGVRRDSVKNDPLPFDLIENESLTREGIYPLDENMAGGCLKGLREKTADSGFKVEKGPFITVSCLTSSENHANKLYSCFSPVMEAMEGSASAHVSALYNIPFIEIRSASNFVGDRNREKWDLPLACSRVCQICLLMLEII